MRVVAPVLGPVWTSGLRLFLGGGALLLYFQIIGFNANWRAHFRHYAVIGVLNSGVPFLLYAYAALHLPASLSAIFNSTAPLFGAVFGAVWLGDRLTGARLGGMALGIVGVAVASWRPGVALAPGSGPATIACLGATCCYGLAGTYLKKFARHVPPLGMAGCSQMLAGVLVLLLTPLSAPRSALTPEVAACLLALALLCSAVAYVLYFRLIADVGPAKALTVTFLIPVFGILWAVLFLGERITVPMLVGCALIVLGTFVVVRPKPAPAA
ncbi:MAG: DMT family transporter [Opitutae bacterium]|nr:DMT family transporter [Opitutae bacterium]